MISHETHNTQTEILVSLSVQQEVQEQVELARGLSLDKAISQEYKYLFVRRSNNNV